MPEEGSPFRTDAAEPQSGSWRPRDGTPMTRMAEPRLALPPPLGTKHVLLTSAQALAGFAQSVATHHIALSSSETSPGCPGGINYTVVITKRTPSARITLQGYNCQHRPKIEPLPPVEN